MSSQGSLNFWLTSSSFFIQFSLTARPVSCKFLNIKCTLLTLFLQIWIYCRLPNFWHLNSACAIAVRFQLYHLEGTTYWMAQFALNMLFEWKIALNLYLKRSHCGHCIWFLFVCYILILIPLISIGVARMLYRCKGSPDCELHYRTT